MRRVLFLVAAVVLAVLGSGSAVRGGDVTYDGRSLIINGQRKIVFSGSIHYPRSTPEMWPSLIAKAKEGGLDAIETYVFWNAHEPQPGHYDFSGGHDIVRFIKEVQAQGLYACLRIGPFIQSEWSYGGLPFWLHDIPGIVFRSDNEPFKVHMQNFTAKVVSMMKSENLYASQGGPIILSQIENEYGTVQKAYGQEGLAYVQWAAQMAEGLQTGVPWVMCKQNNAPGHVINSCNGMKCGQTFVGPNSPNKPSIWTENWTTRYRVYGEDAPIRSAEDIAFHVTLFIVAKNGSFVNYYMYHGGTNFGRTASAFVTTSYYDQAPLDEYGLTTQPKWGHLKELHAAIQLCSTPLLSGVQVNFYLGPQQQAYIFNAVSGECAAFLINNDSRNAASVPFRNASYDLPPMSISILPDCKNVAFNTAKVSTQYTARTMGRGEVLDAADMWQEFTEAIPNFDSTSTRSETLLEQMNTTKDSSDYLWYTLRLQHESSDTQTILDVSSLGHALHAFVNGQAVGSVQGSHKNPRFKFETSVSLSKGINNVSLLSVMVGMPDSGAFLENRAAGLRTVMIRDKQDNNDFTNDSWGYQIGLQGETSQIYTEQGSSQVRWKKFSVAGNPLTWYKTRVDAPPGDVPVALNLASMGKGEAWVNGRSIGRYWPSYRTPNGSAQTWYNVPRSFLKPAGNLLVLQEEKGGNPLQVSLDTVSISQVCGHVTASHLAPVSSWTEHNQRYKNPAKVSGRRPKVQLACPSKSKISRISFASYGTPLGNCRNSLAVGTCHSQNSKAVVEEACLGKMKCSIPVSERRFGGDPCPAKAKSLMVVAECR
ncbi:PREDICTED: beta-galactosidase 16-like [Populus euphratica]|uniref:Beta-galactosidase n=1 Tax=Populus euphratica TaxID=75702 RepID=A0AAJ6T460_POPEU|nr:PREDICTED: beta-galactosidase 16-like [Populus euphratica]